MVENALFPCELECFPDNGCMAFPHVAVPSAACQGLHYFPVNLLDDLSHTDANYRIELTYWSIETSFCAKIYAAIVYRLQVRLLMHWWKYTYQFNMSLC